MTWRARAFNALNALNSFNAFHTPSPATPLRSAMPDRSRMGMSRRRWGIAALGTCATAVAHTQDLAPRRLLGASPSDAVFAVTTAPTAPPAATGVLADPDLVRFAALPMGGALQWRRHWDVMLSALGTALQRPVSSVSVSSEDSLARMLARDPIDLAFLSGPLALQAVLARRMRVVAQQVVDPAHPPHALLLVRRTPVQAPLNELLAQAQRWRIAYGDERSLSGFVVPQAQLFLPRRLPLETAFLDARVGSHQENMLALANGDVDLATSSSLHWACFAQQFPNEAARLHVAWRSSAIAAPVLLVRESTREKWKMQVQRFFTTRAPGPRMHGWQEALAALQMPLGLAPADNRVLQPVATLIWELGRQRAVSAQWVSEAARQARLQRLADLHAQQIQRLLAPPSPHSP